IRMVLINRPRCCRGPCFLARANAVHDEYDHLRSRVRLTRLPETLSQRFEHASAEVPIAPVRVVLISLGEVNIAVMSVRDPDEEEPREFFQILVVTRVAHLIRLSPKLNDIGQLNITSSEVADPFDS